MPKLDLVKGANSWKKGSEVSVQIGTPLQPDQLKFESDHPRKRSVELTNKIQEKLVAMRDKNKTSTTQQ